MPTESPGAMEPALVITPVMAPVPLSRALVLMNRLLAKEWLPPFRCSAAVAAPSPTRNGTPLSTVLPPLLSVPPLKLNTLPAPLVSSSRSTVTVPLLNVSAPRRMSSAPSPVALVASRFPPEMTIRLPVEVASYPTTMLVAKTLPPLVTINWLPLPE